MVYRGSDSSAAAMHVRVNDSVTSEELAEGAVSAMFELPAGEAVLDVWVQQPGQLRVIISDNGTLGDVAVRRVE